MMHKSLWNRFLSVLLLAFAMLGLSQTGLAQSPVFTYYGNVVPTPQNTSPQFISGATPQTTTSLAASAAPTTASSTAQAIVVSRRSTAANVTVTVDRSGQATSPQYSTGESIGVNVTTDQDGYLYIYESTTANVARLVFPPVGDTNVPNRVRGGFTYALPPQGFDYLFTVGDAIGWNKVTAVVSSAPLTEAEVNRIANPSLLNQSTISATAGAYGSGSVDFYLNATASTTIAGTELPGTQTRTIAPLVVNSNDNRGAAIYVQNANAATAARTFTASSGNATYNINVYTLASGAQVGLVDLGNTATTTVTPGRAVAPAPAANTGTLVVRSSNIGASVYVDGNFIGQIASSGELAITGLSLGDHELMAGASGFQTQQIRFRLDSVSQYYDLALSSLSATTAQPTTAVQRSLQNSSTSAQTTTQAATQAAGAFSTAYGHINVNTSLSGVQVFVNGAPMATTPLRAPISLPPNTYSVTLKRDGMTDYTQNITINSNQTEFLQLP